MMSTLKVKKATTLFIFLTVVFDMLAFGMISPVLPTLVAGLLNGDVAKAAELLGWFSFSWAFMQLIASPILGGLSDRYGRKVVIVGSNLGLAIDYVIMAMAPNLFWLWIGRIISGATAASIPTAMAYMSDVTPSDKRAAAFGLLNAAMGIGFVLGPAMGGFLGGIDIHLPFWVAAGLSFTNTLFGLLVLPESLPMDKRRKLSWSSLNPFATFGMLWKNTTVSKYSLITLFGWFAQQILVSVFVIYVSYRYGWSNSYAGLSLTLIGFSSIVIGGMMVKPAVSYFGEDKALLISLSLSVLGYFLCGLAQSSFLFALAIPLMGFWGMAAAIIQAKMTHYFDASEQGGLQGASNSLRSIAALIGPIIFGFVFSYSIQSSNYLSNVGLSFYLSASFVMISLLFVIFKRKSD